MKQRSIGDGYRPTIKAVWIYSSSINCQ